MALNLAQAGDETARQFQAIDDSIGDVGFSEGLALRRQKLEELKGKTQAVENYNQGQGSKLVADVTNMGNRVPGQAPSDLLRAGLSMETAQKSLLSESAANEIDALDALTKFINSAKESVRQEENNSVDQEVQLYRDGLKPITDLSDEALYQLRDEIRGTDKELLVKPSEETALLNAVVGGEVSLKDLTPTERGKVIIEAQKRGIQLPNEKGKEEKAARESIEAQLNQFEELTNSMITGRIGGPIGSLMSMIGIDSGKRRQLEQMVNIAAPILGVNVLKLGRLTNEDIELAKKVLPSPDDTPQEITAKIANIRALLERTYGKSDSKESKKDNFDSFRGKLQKDEELYYNPKTGDIVAVSKGEQAPEGYERR